VFYSLFAFKQNVTATLAVSKNDLAKLIFVTAL